MQRVTLALCMHRPEMIPLISDYMQRHEAIFLEEPPDAHFERMLKGTLSIDDYVGRLDVEYPAFNRGLCSLMLRLNARGKHILQVEPFLQILLSIHELFAAGHRPADLDRASIQYPVYLAEKNATQALLAYYQIAVTGQFHEAIEAIRRFARMDAARFRLRDSLRAQEIVPLARKYSSVYIEGGLMHYPLWQLLRQQSEQQLDVRLLFLANMALTTKDAKFYRYGPGDRLTLLYVFHPEIHDPIRENLLAARSIIYSKIVEKNEISDAADTFPHLRNEVDCIRTTARLSFDDCRRLFPLVQKASSSDSRQIVAEYLAKLD